ncbi:hypothetical protein [Mycobacterium asiaticum]|uniref:hypothetical protein n=1 Tax=Mycobacterium asiaticum TaxID=1790 RepID=UPI0009BD08BA|nr:hypothetical protein [Mycobacterium asiaticum]
MKFELNLLQRRRKNEEGRKPSHLFGGRVRTSTLVLIVVFVALWWTYETYGPSQEPARSNTPPSQVVPPGFVPDPNYTWVPRTRVQQQQPTTPTPTPTPTTTVPPTTTTTTPSPSPPPCLLPPPFCPASSTPTSPPSSSPPGPGPTPTTTPAR